MRLIIERHSSDLIKTSKTKVVIDGKIKYRLLPGESVEADIDDGLHKIECSLNLMKAFAEISCPPDNRIVVFYRPSPAGICIQGLPDEKKASRPAAAAFFAFKAHLTVIPASFL